MNAPPSPTAEFAAFSGLPISGGCGLRQPIFHSTESDQFFAYHDNNENPRWFGSNEFGGLVEQELVTRVSPRLVVPKTGLSALYADIRFVGPSPRLPTNALEYDRRNRLYLALVPRNEATAILNYWCSVLLGSVRKILGEWNVGEEQNILEQAEADLQRARFCTAEATGSDLRREVLLWQLVLARMLPGEPSPEKISEDAVLDLPPQEVGEIIRESQLKQLELLYIKKKRKPHEQCIKGRDLAVFDRRDKSARATECGASYVSHGTEALPI